MKSYDYRKDMSVVELSGAAFHINSCYHCHEENFIAVDPEDLESWQTHGNYIQDAFPYLTPDQRELVKTGIHPECWTAMFGEDDEED